VTVPPSPLVLRKLFESWELGSDLCFRRARGVFWWGICQVGLV
jgi:hypothetical protein